MKNSESDRIHEILENQVSDINPTRPSSKRENCTSLCNKNGVLMPQPQIEVDTVSTPNVTAIWPCWNYSMIQIVHSKPKRYIGENVYKASFQYSIPSASKRTYTTKSIHYHIPPCSRKIILHHTPSRARIQSSSSSPLRTTKTAGKSTLRLSMAYVPKFSL